MKPQRNPRCKKRLTDAAITRLKPDPKKRIEIQDLAVPGLRLRISPSGKKSWSLMYKVDGEAADGGRGKNRRMTLGAYPLISLADARDKAGAAKDLADRGQDPALERRAEILERQSRRVESLVERFIELQAKPSTKNWKSTQTLLSSTVAEHWLGRDVETLSRHEIHSYLDELIAEKGTGKAREVRKHLSIFLNWCVDRGFCNTSPMAGMKRKDLSYVPRDRVLSLDELRLVWRASYKIGYPFGNMVRLLILTGQRLREIAELRRKWLKTDRIEIPPESYKTNTAHVVPLTAQSLEELDKLPNWLERDFLFSTTAGKKPVSGFSRAKRRLDKNLELDPWTFHDIRRSVATHMANYGVLQEHIERVLGHKILGVAGTYNQHSYFDEKLKALEGWNCQFCAPQCT